MPNACIFFSIIIAFCFSDGYSEPDSKSVSDIQIQDLLDKHNPRFKDLKLPSFDDLPDWKTFVNRHMNEKLRDEIASLELPKDGLEGSLPQNLEKLIQWYEQRAASEQEISAYPNSGVTAEL
eukprot:jgi/Botrbrau1/5067/Bobra.37_1s0031.1